MSDTGDDFRAFDKFKRTLRNKYAVDCPQCKLRRPKTYPTRLMPNQKCKVDGYRDPRPELTQADWDQVAKEMGDAAE